MFATIPPQPHPHQQPPPTLGLNFNFNLDITPNTFAFQPTPHHHQHHQQQQPQTLPNPNPKPETYATRYLTKTRNPLSQHQLRTNTNATTATKATDTTANGATTNKNAKTSTPRTKRQQQYLNRVKRDRDEGRFEERGERTMRLEWIGERERWARGMERDAEVVWGDGGGEDEGDGGEDVMGLDIGEEGGEVPPSSSAVDVDLDVDVDGEGGQGFGPPGGGELGDLADSDSFSDEEYERIFLGLVGSGDSSSRDQEDQMLDLELDHQSMDLSSG